MAFSRLAWLMALVSLALAASCSDSGGTDPTQTSAGGSSGKGGKGGSAGKGGSSGKGGGQAGGSGGSAGNEAGGSAGAGQGGAGAGGAGSAGAGAGGAGSGGSPAGAGGGESAGAAGAGAGGSAGGAGQGGAGGGSGGGAGVGQGGSGGAAVEICNGKDDDGDGKVDEGCDEDGDGYCAKGMETTAEAACKKGDCDDSSNKIYPGSKEHIEGIDYDCDGKNEYMATLIVTVDDEATELCANGLQIALGPNKGNWTATDTYSFVLESGPNAVGISGVDKGKVITAMAAHLSVNGTSYPSRGVPAGKIYQPSDPEWTQTPWRYFGKKVEEDKTNWCESTFDDSTWGPAMAAADASSPSARVGDATPWKCGTDLCTAFPAGDQRPDWIWDPFPVDLQSAWIRIKIELP